jgi:hypothetical protein
MARDPKVVALSEDLRVRLEAIATALECAAMAHNMQAFQRYADRLWDVLPPRIPQPKR